MNERDAEGVLTVAMLAAMADGRTHADERDQARSLYESLSAEHDLPALAEIQQQVLLGRVAIPDAAALLSTDDARRMAFEIAVCVADADGRTTPEEQQFLDDLERALAINHDDAVDFELEASLLAEDTDDRIAASDDPVGLIPLEPTPHRAAAPAPAPTPAQTPSPEEQAKRAANAEADKILLRYAILNGALELLPQNLATMAILPLQTRMVYAIGKQHGYTLGAAHIKEFIATLGLGATSQMLENFARKALGKLAKKALGKTAGKIAKAATGPLMTFATTYAIGKVAKAYYAGGRTLSAVDLRSMFQRDLAEGKAAFERYRPDVERQAGSLDAGAVLDMVRGKRTV